MRSNLDEENMPGQSQSLHRLFRFFSGDLPLFAFERWLHESDVAEILPTQVLADLRCLDFDGEDIHAQVREILNTCIEPGAFEAWHLQHLLPWIFERDPRATKAMAFCHQYFERGLKFLWPIAQAFCTGKLDTGGFDWVPVETAAPELQPVALFIFNGLASGEIVLQSDQRFVLSGDCAVYLGGGAAIGTGSWRELSQTLQSI